MKKILKMLGYVLLGVYGVIALLSTILLLNYNEYNITQFGDKTLIVVKDDSLEPKYVKGDLLVVTMTSFNKINKGDELFFYHKDLKDEMVYIDIAEVQDINIRSSKDADIRVNNDYVVGDKNVIGTGDNVKIYHNLGTYINLVTSRIGFLFLIIFPIAVIFIYEIAVVVREIKDEK